MQRAFSALGTVSRPLALTVAIALGACAPTPPRPPSPVAPPPPSTPPAETAPQAPAAPEVSKEEPREEPVEVLPPVPPGPPPQARFYFDFNSQTLRPADLPQLQTIAALMKERPEAFVLLEGHSDTQGSREMNLALAQRRAEAVQRALIELGVSDRRIRVVSYGEERAQGAAAERRRVDVHVSPQR